MKQVIISLLVMGLIVVSGSSRETKRITLSITHPGFESKKAEEHDLEVKLDAGGNPLGYAMEVTSVFCSDEKCDVITLTMLWDSIGRFADYQLPQGSRLTKYEHEPFQKADYTKFDQLMRKRRSVLGDLDIKEIVVKQKEPAKNTGKGSREKPKDVAGKSDAVQKVDAISGATPSHIQQEVVEGAAYTCFTMWHWANGNTALKIRQHAQQLGKRDWLMGMLESDDTAKIDFALEAIVSRKFNDSAAQAKLIAAAKVASMDGFKMIASQLEATHPQRDAFYAALQELMAAGNTERRIHLLEQIDKLKQAPPMALLEQNAAKLAAVENFYELQLLLKIADKHQAQSDVLLSGIAKVLDHENFFFSRRAYGFLKDKKLPAEIHRAVENFEKKHAGSL